jgi:hypothetical protein
VRAGLYALGKRTGLPDRDVIEIIIGFVDELILGILIDLFIGMIMYTVGTVFRALLSGLWNFLKSIHGWLKHYNIAVSGDAHCHLLFYAFLGSA